VYLIGASVLFLLWNFGNKHGPVWVERLEVASLRRAFKSCGTDISFDKVPAVRLGIGPNN